MQWEYHRQQMEHPRRNSFKIREYEMLSVSCLHGRSTSLRVMRKSRKLTITLPLEDELVRWLQFYRGGIVLSV